MRSATEINANKDIELTGNEANLVAYYKFNDGSGQIATDQSSTTNNAVLGSSNTAYTDDPTWVKVNHAITSVSSYRYGFNGMEKDDSIKGEGNSLDFGARIYDPRLGRFLSLDPLMSSFSWNSPYSFAVNSPIVMVDFLGEKGTIYMQVLTDENGEPALDNETMESVKQRMVEEYREKHGVDVEVQVVYSNDILSKTEFYEQEGADETDTYVILGGGKEVNEAQVESGNLGWAKDWSAWGSDVNGTSNGTDNIVVVNTDNTKKTNGENIYESKDQFSDVIEKTAVTVMHESGHWKFKGHPLNHNGAVFTQVVMGHVGGTIMDKSPNGDSTHDSWMVDRLKALHGSTGKTPPPVDSSLDGYTGQYLIL